VKTVDNLRNLKEEKEVMELYKLASNPEKKRSC